MKKIFYSPVQKILIGMLIVCSISLFLSDNVFRWEETGNPCTFSYISRGAYVLDVTCTPSDRKNQVTVFSKEVADANGKAGMVLAQADVEPGGCGVSMQLSLEDGIYSVCVVTSLDTEETTMVESARLESQGIIYRDGTALGILCLLAAIALSVIFVKVPRETYQLPLLAVIIGLIAGIPMYADFIMDGHDFSFHLQRIEGIYQAMASGDFPVRLNPLQVNGYGYLSSTMYPQLFLYPVALLRFFNVSVMTCYKLLLTLTNVGTALIAYYVVKSITQSGKIGILMSFLYTLSAYRLMGMYMRCAIGEVLAMTFLPLVMGGGIRVSLGRTALDYSDIGHYRSIGIAYPVYPGVRVIYDSGTVLVVAQQKEELCGETDHGRNQVCPGGCTAEPFVPCPISIF